LLLVGGNLCGSGFVTHRLFAVKENSKCGRANEEDRNTLLSNRENDKGTYRTEVQDTHLVKKSPNTKQESKKVHISNQNEQTNHGTRALYAWLYSLRKIYKTNLSV
jgi:hypothetical protein